DKRAVPIFLRMLRQTPEVGTLIIPALAKLGDRQAIPPLLECLQGTNQALRKEALRALVTLTDAPHAEQVLKAVVAARDTADAELKEVLTSTASALVSKFGAAAVGGSTQSTTANSMIVQHQSLLHDTRSVGNTGVLGVDMPDLAAIVTDDHALE